MGFDPFEATFITFCEALQVEFLDDKERLIAQINAKDDFSAGYYEAMRQVFILLEQQIAKHGLLLHKPALVSFCRILQDIVLEDKKGVKSQTISSDLFHTGHIDGISRVLSLLEQQAAIFELSLENIGLDKIKPTDL